MGIKRAQPRLAGEGCTNFVRAKGEEPLAGVSHELRSRIGRALNSTAGAAPPPGIKHPRNTGTPQSNKEAVIYRTTKALHTPKRATAIYRTTNGSPHCCSTASIIGTDRQRAEMTPCGIKYVLYVKKFSRKCKRKEKVLKISPKTCIIKVSLSATKF